ncbi:sensor histidine kinase [Streptomyces sp. NPDC059070]|uniref:sensor histidine kinase n=1 Tax=Streptomyces sp. NPDC059070 TaxID=3346713 RepID=UPI0036A9518B
MSRTHAAPAPPGPAGPGGAEPADALPWSRHDALVAVGATVLDLLGFVLSSRIDHGSVPAVGCVLVVVCALPLVFRRRAPLTVFVAVLLAGLALNLSVPVNQHMGATTAVALFTVVRSVRPVVWSVASLVTVVAALVGPEPGPKGLALDAASSVAAVTLVSGAAVLTTRWQRNLEANRKLLADRAVADERRRIARELHDIVAHHITTMQLMAGGARANLARDPEVAREALITLEGSGRMALREMRQLLDVLRAGDETEEAPTSPQPGIGDLERIVAESSRAGLPAELDVRGEERALPPSVGLTVFRLVQEALTNARKYAGEARASVRLTYAVDGLAVEVSDDGSGASPGPGGGPGQGSGYGLLGMRERVALHGGTLEAGPRDGGGFRVAARLPLKAEEGALR